MFSQYKDIDASLLIRIDFSDDATWAEVVKLASATYEDDFCAILKPVDDIQCDSMTVAQLTAHAIDSFEGRALFLADSRTMTLPEYPILCVEISKETQRSFYAIPSQLWSVENNLRLSNMDFTDFHDAVDTDGTFRGFK